MGATYQQENTEGVCCGCFRGFGVDDECQYGYGGYGSNP